MNIRNVLIIFCIGLSIVYGSCVGAETDTAQAKADQESSLSEIKGVNAKSNNLTLGSVYKDTGYKFELELSSKGAAIVKATMSEFDDRDPNNPQPFVLLRPIVDEKEIYSLSNSSFVLSDQQRKPFPLDKLHWQTVDGVIKEPSNQRVSFEAVLMDADDKEAVKLTKTYRVRPDSYDVECELRVENLTEVSVSPSFKMYGPAGIGREGLRGDMRKVIGGFINSKGQIVSSRKDIPSPFLGGIFSSKVGLKASTRSYKEALQSGNQSGLLTAKEDIRIGRNLPRNSQPANFVWAATTNKYFAAIVRPVPEEGREYCEWIKDRLGFFHNPDDDKTADSGDESISIEFEIASPELAPKGLDGCTKTFKFQVYLGPKDKRLFEKNVVYRELGYLHSIDFRSCCCCPGSIIRPLAFAIIGIMNWLYQYVGNYGVVIIILVFLMRLLMHPVTKKSQVSMMRMQKLAPKVEQIRNKYANNKAEMNKHIMALYREQGASPVMGFLPMMLQLPVWIALWTAVYTSIDLRGAGFLPFWITDLSAPDALIRFKEVIIPVLGWKIDSFNLLPILMGVVMYLQQKLMPHSSSAQTNPQIAQQQKMMMVMMPLMFPLLLYKGPSGVNLYIMSSISAGVVEQMVIRKHIREKEAEESSGLVPTTSKTGGKVKKKKPKPFYKDH